MTEAETREFAVWAVQSRKANQIGCGEIAVDNNAVALKRFANLRASASLAGHELHRHDDGTFEARRWGMSRNFIDLESVERWLRNVTGDYPGRRGRERRSMVDAANRAQDRLDEVADYERGPGGEL
jgi:hypothetical protein